MQRSTILSLELMANAKLQIMQDSPFNWQIPPDSSILIVDDELDQLDILMELIERSRMPIKVYRAPGADLALQLLERIPIQLIMTDWAMPEMNGMEFLAALRARPALAEIPVIFCTGAMTTPQDLAEALNRGAVDYVRKPVDESEFLARIRSALLLADAQRRLKELNMSKDQMFGQLAHELIETVGQVEMVLEMVDMLWVSDAAQARVYFRQALQKAGQSRLFLLKILTWARYRFAPWPLALEPVSLRLIFESLIARFESKYPQQGLKFRLRCNHQLKVLSDPDLLTELLASLIEQLLKTASGDEVVLRAVVETSAIRCDIEVQGPADPVEITQQAASIEARMESNICSELVRLLGTRLDRQQERQGLWRISLDLCAVSGQAKAQS